MLVGVACGMRSACPRGYTATDSRVYSCFKSATNRMSGRNTGGICAALDCEQVICAAC